MKITKEMLSVKAKTLFDWSMNPNNVIGSTVFNALSSVLYSIIRRGIIDYNDLEYKEKLLYNWHKEQESDLYLEADESVYCEYNDY